MKFIRTIFISLLLIFLASCGGSDPKTPEDVACTYIQNVYAGDMDKVKDMFYIPAENKEMMDQMMPKLEMFVKKAQQKAEARGGVKSVTVTDKQETQDAIKLNVKVTFKDGSEKRERVKLVKVDSEYKVEV